MPWLLTLFFWSIALQVWHDDDERTITLQLKSNDSDALRLSQKVVQSEIAAILKAQDYIGEEGASLRAKANRCAMRRGRCLALSQHAYEQGDRAEAKRWSELGEQMRLANVHARNAIYAHRNAGKDPLLFLDLHGLYVQVGTFLVALLLAKVQRCDKRSAPTPKDVIMWLNTWKNRTDV